MAYVEWQTPSHLWLLVGYFRIATARSAIRPLCFSFKSVSCLPKFEAEPFAPWTSIACCSCSDPGYIGLTIGSRITFRTLIVSSGSLYWMGVELEALVNSLSMFVSNVFERVSIFVCTWMMLFCTRIRVPLILHLAVRQLFHLPWTPGRSSSLHFYRGIQLSRTL